MLYTLSWARPRAQPKARGRLGFMVLGFVQGLGLQSFRVLVSLEFSGLRVSGGRVEGRRGFWEVGGKEALSSHLHFWSRPGPL